MLPLEWICLQFDKGHTVSEESLRAAFDDSLVQQGLLVLNYLVAQGIALQTTLKGHPVFEARDVKAVRQLLEDLQTSPVDRTSVSTYSSSSQDQSDARTATETLVVSAPLSLTGKLRSLQANYSHLAVEEIKASFSKLLKSAQYEVLLSVPFLELDGLMVFVDEIKALGSRHVSVKALTRELLAPGRYDYSYYQKLRAFSKLVDLYVSEGGSSEFVEVRDYTIKMGSSGDKGIVYEGIHQKMIVCDRARAYIGSGEIRAASFVVNGDVGVVQTGRAAEFWASYFLLFWDEAQVVEHRFFRATQT